MSTPNNPYAYSADAISNKWQPIETAIDETGPVLLFSSGNEDEPIWVGSRQRYPFASAGPDGWSCPHGWCSFDAPSHWMPLPDPPEEGE